ncbi:MAG: hypothetical protein CR991_04275 [Proteobacteria bacterium]|nr:MAG: hypothetical protein CR991_04275 [Pseudomonadota bacterium]
MTQNEGNLRVIRQTNQNIVIMEGMLDHEFARSLVPLAEKLTPPIIFDASRVSLITAAGSRVLLAFYQHFGVKPVLLNASPNILDVLKLTGTINYITLANDQPSLLGSTAK